MATVSNTCSSTGDYYTYSDCLTFPNLPVTTSGLHYDYVIYDDFPKEAKKKGDDKMTALWRVIVLDPKSELFEEIKVIAKTKEMAIHKAISRSGMSAKYVDDFEIVVEKLIEYEKQSSKKELKEALKEAMEE